MPKQIKVTDELYERLKARANGQPIPQLIRALLDGEGFKDEGDALLEQLDAQYEKQNEPTVETIDTSEWVAGVAPECCCDFYYNYNYNHKSGPCEHWKRVRWTDRNGNSKVNWYNDLINKFDFADDWKIAMKEYID